MIFNSFVHPLTNSERTPIGSTTSNLIPANNFTLIMNKQFVVLLDHFPKYMLILVQL